MAVVTVLSLAVKRVAGWAAVYVVMWVATWVGSMDGNVAAVSVATTGEEMV